MASISAAPKGPRLVANPDQLTQPSPSLSDWDTRGLEVMVQPYRNRFLQRFIKSAS